ncbi:MAG: hypothetical protein KDA57_20905, partial [Planctomycetales bacterium]|nr:hypothetical protein [Planctomycetales bacterium]
TVWVYYAGHAAPEESSLYWVTHDADVDDLYGTGLSNDQISKVLEDIRAKRLLVLLDCCHAAATAAQKNPTRAVLTADEVFSCYKGHGRITLSSSDGKEKSVELGDVGHGAFTYFLEQGLRGEADADGDGVVTADELWAYLRSKVVDASQKAGNTQTPVLLGEMRHDFALSLNPISVGQKKKLAELVTSLIGLGADKLTTEETGVCLEILKRPPRTPQEDALVQELGKGLGGDPNVRLLKVLIDGAKRTSRTKTSPVNQELPIPQGSVQPKPSDGGSKIASGPLLAANLKKLCSSSTTLRLEGAKSLHKMGVEAKPALAGLSLCLSDEVYEVRNAARKAIRAIGFGDACLPGIRKALASDSWSIRCDTARFLGSCGPAAESALPLVMSLFSDGVSEVRSTAEYAVDRLRGVPRMPRRILVLDVAHTVLRSPVYVARALWRFGEETAGFGLIAVLGLLIFLGFLVAQYKSDVTTRADVNNSAEQLARFLTSSEPDALIVMSSFVIRDAQYARKSTAEDASQMVKLFVERKLLQAMSQTAVRLVDEGELPRADSEPQRSFRMMGTIECKGAPGTERILPRAVSLRLVSSDGGTVWAAEWKLRPFADQVTP